MYSQSQPVPAKTLSAYDIYIQENIARREASRGRIHGYVPKNEPIPDNHFAHPHPEDATVPAARGSIPADPDITIETAAENEKNNPVGFAFRTLYKQPESITNNVIYSTVGKKTPGYIKSGLPVIHESVTVFKCRAGPGSLL